MSNFDALLAAFAQIMSARDIAESTAKIPQYIEIGAAMARDPEVKQRCNIQNNHGSFLGIGIQVVPDIKPVYAESTHEA